MKTITITALMATLLAIPLILHKRKPLAGSGEPESVSDDSRRYDIFDFVS